MFWGVSDNDGKWWSDHAEELIGFVPRDSADALADQVPPLPADADPVAERYQGGAFCSDGYGRSEPSPKRLFRTSSIKFRPLVVNERVAAAFFAPKVDSGPWPGTNVVSSPIGHSLVRIEP